MKYLVLICVFVILFQCQAQVPILDMDGQETGLFTETQYFWKAPRRVGYGYIGNGNVQFNGDNIVQRMNVYDQGEWIWIIKQSEGNKYNIFNKQTGLYMFQSGDVRNGDYVVELRNKIIDRSNFQFFRQPDQQLGIYEPVTNRYLFASNDAWPEDKLQRQGFLIEGNTDKKSISLFQFLPTKGGQTQKKYKKHIRKGLFD